MKPILATSAILTVLAAPAFADLSLNMKADAGLVGGEDFFLYLSDGSLFVPDGDTHLYTEINAQAVGRGETDNGLSFGASVDLDVLNNSDGTIDDARIWVSGRFGTLGIGDFDGAFDWAMREAHLGLTIDDTEKHAGWSGNSGLDGTYNGTILRYVYSGNGFAVATSLELDEYGNDPVIGIGGRYTINHNAGDVTFGVGYQKGDGPFDSDDTQEIWGVSVTAEFYNGFEAVLNYSRYDYDDDFTGTFNGDWKFEHIGLAVGYTIDDLTVSANWGQIDQSGTYSWRNNTFEGYSLVANYDLGGGAEVRAGYAHGSGDGENYDHWSLGMSFSF
ncbi:porin [Actibacterium pelagium]|uniref:Porin n=1 Tax=Actibacterium pelagium TaxID=2029103 RepID=A0A917AIU2_9RHOB|nr:porin [Actibacterium pelagium]GGE56492.1 porin [Actibacterium pelagium]